MCFILSLILSFFHEELAAWGYRVDLWLLWTSVALALLALTVYTVQAWKQLYRTDGQNSDPPGKIH